MNENFFRRARCAILAVAAGAALQTGCGGDSPDMAELREQQRQILAKLDSIEKKIAQPPPERARRPPPGPDPDKAHEIPVGGSPVKGPENAPVTIVEFSDYQCPFCARSEPVVAQVVREYGDKVRFVYKHFPLVSIHPRALPAALAAAAADRQGKFWEMHEVLFANQRALQSEQLKGYAERLGLDVQKFEADLQAPETRKLVQDDVRLAQQLGVRGTPTVFVNGKLLRDRTPEGFKQAIDLLLKQDAAG
jgi:protein-disulfide isomerase